MSNSSNHQPAVKTNLFISYSRKDRAKIEQLYTALESEDELNVFRDTTDILPSEEWKPRLETLIKASDTIIFALTPQSAVSDVCRWELELAESLNKRIVPVVVENVDGEVPDVVSKLNYIFLTEQDNFTAVLPKIQDAISLDISWVREHTRLADLADRWEKTMVLGAQPLRGKELERAETWLVNHPKGAPAPTRAHRNYILASRKSATKRQRVVAIGSICALVVVSVLGAFAWQQKGVALINAEIAQEQKTLAEENEQLASRQLNQARIQQARFLAGESKRATASGDHNTGLQLARLAMPQAHPEGWPTIDEVPQALSALNKAIYHQRKLESYGPTGRSVQRVAVSELGDLIALAEGDHSISIWNTASNTLVSTLRGHSDTVQNIAFLGATSRLVTSSRDGTTKIWSTSEGQEETSLSSYSQLSPFAISADARFLAFSQQESPDNRKARVVVWDIANSTIVKTFPWTQELIFDIAFSPKGKTLVFALGDGDVQLWDLATNQAIAMGGKHKNSATSIRFTHRGDAFFTGSIDRTVKVWDASTGALKATLGGMNGSISDIALSKDRSKVLVSTYENLAYLWHLPTNFLLGTMSGHKGSILVAKFSPDDRFVVTGSQDQTLKIWDVETAKQTGSVSFTKEGDVKFGQASGVTDIAFLPNSSHAVIASMEKGAYRVSVEHIPFSKELGLTKENMGHAVFQMSGGLLAVSHADQTISVWDAATGRKTNTLEGHDGMILGLRSNPDKARVVSWSLDGTARIWDLGKGGVQTTLTGHIKGLRDAAFLSYGNQIATSAYDDTIRIWHEETGQELAQFEEKGVIGLVPSPDGGFLLGLVDNGPAILWDLKQGRKVEMFPNILASSADFSSDGTMLALGGYNGQVVMLETKNWTTTANLAPHGDYVATVNFSADGAYLATSGYDGYSKIWQTDAFDLTFEKQHKRVIGSKFIPDSHKLVIQTLNDAYVFDADTNRRLLDFAFPKLKNIVMSPAGDKLIFVPTEGRVALVDLIKTADQAYEVSTQLSSLSEPLSPRQRCDYYLDGKDCE